MAYLCRCSKTQSHWPDYRLSARCWHPQWALPLWRRLQWEQRQIQCFPLASLMSMGSSGTVSNSKQSGVQDGVHMWLYLPVVPGVRICWKWIIRETNMLWACYLFSAISWLVLHVGGILAELMDSRRKTLASYLDCTVGKQLLIDWLMARCTCMCTEGRNEDTKVFSERRNGDT